MQRFVLSALLWCAGCPEGSIATDASVHSHDGHYHGDVGIPIEPVDAGPLPDAARPDAGEEGWVWRLPAGFPTPLVPDANPMSAAKVELGRHLFYDERMSGNETQSCASCHHQERAFTDGLPVSIGSTGERTPRNSMSLANTAYVASYTWANSLLFDFEAQAVVPMFGRKPVELGLSGREDELLERLRAEPRYTALFPRAFPGEVDPITVQNVVRALSAFERTIISGNSAYDRFVYGGDREALSEAARRGLTLFTSERLECFHCHAGFNFSDSLYYAGGGPRALRFHNTGLYNIGGTGDYPPGGTGLHEISGRAEDMGRFRTPSLRNVAVTAPYMHDGSIATLDEVLDHYARGGRLIESGPFAGDGSRNPYKSGFIIGFTLSAEERADVVAFLESLTDEDFLTREDLSDPWTSPCVHCE